MTKIFMSNHVELPGTDLNEVMRLARRHYHTIQKRSPRRRPYVRSTYFTKDKIFINNFWEHLNQKSPQERVRRLKLYVCAIDLLRKSPYPPDSIYAHPNRNIGLHRFYGQAHNGQQFCVQVKEY